MDVNFSVENLLKTNSIKRQIKIIYEVLFEILIMPHFDIHTPLRECCHNDARFRINHVGVVGHKSLAVVIPR